MAKVGHESGVKSRVKIWGDCLDRPRKGSTKDTSMAYSSMINILDIRASVVQCRENKSKKDILINCAIYSAITTSIVRYFFYP